MPASPFTFEKEDIDPTDAAGATALLDCRPPDVEHHRHGRHLRHRRQQPAGGGITRPYVGRLGRPRRTALWSPERVDTRQGQPARHEKRQAVITGMHHFSLSVADMDRSMAFYREFGFELVSDREVEGTTWR